MGTAACHWLPTRTATGVTVVQLPEVRLVLDWRVKPEAAAGHANIKLPPDGVAVIVTFVVSTWFGPSNWLAAISAGDMTPL